MERINMTTEELQKIASKGTRLNVGNIGVVLKYNSYTLELGNKVFKYLCQDIHEMNHFTINEFIDVEEGKVNIINMGVAKNPIVINSGLIVGMTTGPENWDNVDKTLGDKDLEIKFFKDLKSQIVTLLNAGVTHEGIFRMINDTPVFNIVQNGKEATIFSMYSPYVISNNDITSYRRRTQNTWAGLVNFINYCSTLHGQGILYDTTKYMDQDKADELIAKFEKTI